MKEKLLKKLEKYGYDYHVKENQIDINISYSHIIKIEFLKNNKIIISDKLKGWNFLTGMIQMSIKKSMLYLTIGLFFILISHIVINRESTSISIPFLYIIIGVSNWIIIWTAYYLIKFENLKKQIISWIDNND